MITTKDTSTALGSDVAYEEKTIFLRGRGWRVTPFHYLVGEISRPQFDEVAFAWRDAHGDFSEAERRFVLVFIDSRDPFSRLAGAREVVSMWRKCYANAWLLFYTDDHRVLDDLLPEEASLATSLGGDVSATNFLDLPETTFKSPADLKGGAGDYWLTRVEEFRRRRMASAFLKEVDP